MNFSRKTNAENKQKNNVPIQKWEGPGAQLKPCRAAAAGLHKSCDKKGT